MILLAFCLGNLWVAFDVLPWKCWSHSIAVYPIWSTTVSTDFSKIWTILYFLYNFVRNLHVPSFPLSLIEVGADYHYLNISLLLHDNPQISERPMNEHISNARTIYPKFWLDLDDSRFVLSFGSLHLNPCTTISRLFNEKTLHILWSMRLFHPSSNEAKKYSRLVATSLSVLSQKVLQNLAALFSLVWSMKESGPKIWILVYM